MPESTEHAARENSGELEELSEEERVDANRRSAPHAGVVHEAVRLEGDVELLRSSHALAWSGLAAGLSMGFSLLAEGLLSAHLPDRSWRILISKFGYSVGYLIVILGRQQLFTENTITVILPLLVRKDAHTLRNVARLWTVVLVANLVGALGSAAFLHSPGVFDTGAIAAFLRLGRLAMSGTFLAIFCRGIYAGWLIALLVWLLPAAESARVAVIFVITYVIGIAGLSHVIAGSVEALYVVLGGGATWSAYAVGYLLPTLLGNIVGGVALAAVLNHAQVVAGRAESA